MIEESYKLSYGSWLGLSSSTRRKYSIWEKVGLNVIGLGNLYGRDLILKAYIWTLIPALAITQAFKFSAPLLRLHSSDCSEEKIKHVLSRVFGLAYLQSQDCNVFYLT
ncbi:hypothetical protein ABKV19_008232 [Rosa sericea]